MSDLPLFPLYTVLFPHTPIQLHIFEDRYQQMIGMCLQEQRPFGVVLIRRGAEALGPLAAPYLIGCTAEIIATQPLDEGRMNLVALGRERFKILSLDSTTHPYLIGVVEPYPWRMDSPEALAERGAALLALLRRYLYRLADISGSEAPVDAGKLPKDVFELACLAAAVLEIDPTQKQALLERESLGVMLDDLISVYRREAVLIQALHARGERSESPFSLN